MSDSAWQWAQRIAAAKDVNSITAVDFARLKKATHAYTQSQGAVTIDRCLGLRGARASWNKAERDAWIRLAAVALGCPNQQPPRTARVLDEEWARFVAAGAWRLWRGKQDPPADVDALRRALFYATRHNGDAPLGYKQIHRVLVKTGFGADKSSSQTET